MKKLFLLGAMVCALGMMTAEAQTEAKGSVMTVRVCDIDTTKADDTTLVGYVFMEHYGHTIIDRSGKEDTKEDTFEMEEYTPTMEEVREAERLLLKKYPTIMPGEKDKLGRMTRPRLKSYVRQYIFGVASDGKRYVWVNAVSKEQTWLMDRIKEQTIHVRDGGNAFWQTLLNLDDGTMVFNMVNGEA